MSSDRPSTPTEAGESEAERRRLALRYTAWAVAGVGALVALCACYSIAVALFGPPSVEAREVYADRPPGPSVDHGTLDGLLARHVDGSGYVDYRGLAQQRSLLDDYLATVAAAPLADLDRDEMLALCINAYNAFTLVLMLDHLPVDSIRDIPESERWERRRWNLGGRTVSLAEIEHDWLRARFVEPRIHFAIVCASIGCPALRREAYDAARIERQLGDQVERTFRDSSRWFEIRDLSRDPPRAAATPILWWYAGDFAQTHGSKEAWLAAHVPAFEGRTPVLERLPYDWTINAQRVRDD